MVVTLRGKRVIRYTQTVHQQQGVVGAKATQIHLARIDCSTTPGGWALGLERLRQGADGLVDRGVSLGLELLPREDRHRRGSLELRPRDTRSGDDDLLEFRRLFGCSVGLVDRLGLVG